jgi:molybdenum cofactor synthesis domain-containing protein
VITLEEAKQFVLESLVAPSPEVMALEDVLGCVVGEEVLARESVPEFLNSSMDGFALRALDTATGSATGSTTLRVIGAVYAGDGSSPYVGSGEAARIMTGAPLPDGADCVCMKEEAIVDPSGQTVRIERTIPVGEYVRAPGEDVQIGQVLVVTGDELNPAKVGVLAGQGFAAVRAFRRPRVGVLSTGNELARSLAPLESGEIRDVNRPLLLALVRESGCLAVDLGIVHDDYASIAQRLRVGVQECDAVISTGGVSVGDLDHVKTVIGELGGDSARSMQVAIRPGKPFAFGVVGARHVPVFGLPGNPVSTRVSFELFVRPSLRFLAGHRVLERPTFNMVLDSPLPRSKDGKLHLVHVVARIHDDGTVHVERAIRHGSHLLSAISDANALAMVPEGEGLSSGDIVRAMILNADQLSAPSS